VPATASHRHKEEYRMTRSILALMLLALRLLAQEKREKTVILVHGAFADGSSWTK